MTPLPTPVKRLLRPATTLASTTRMWNRIEARTRGASSPGAPRRRRTWGILALAAALSVLSATLVALAGGWARSVRASREHVASAGASDRVRDRSPATGAGALASGATAADSGAARASAVEPAVSEIVRAVPVAPPHDAVAGSPRRVTDPPVWRQWAARGDPQRAYAELGPDGLARTASSASVEDLFGLADVARLSGHPAEAVAPLERVVRDHADDPRAPLASYSLGRVRLRSLGRPAAAAAAFERALALKIPAGLEEETYALWIESLAAAGDPEGAARAYERYLSSYPGAARKDELKKWSRAP